MKVRALILRIVFGSAAGLVLLAVGLAALLPRILPYVPFPDQTFELAPQLTEAQCALVTNTQVTVDFAFHRARARDLTLRAHGRLLDWPYSLRADFDYSLIHRSAEGTFTLGLDGTPWKLAGKFGGSVSDGWTADVAMEPETFTESDPVLGGLLSRAVAPAVTNLTVNGKLGFEAHFNSTNALAMPTWSAQVRLTEVMAALTAAEKDISLKGLRLRAAATGYGNQVSIQPMFPRAESVDVANVSMTNVFASIRATEKSYLITEAGADVCGGQVRLYALFLNPERLTAGVTLFLDDIDTGMVLNRISGFQGSATGRLHGKLPLKLYNGKRLSWGDGYLYSIPGETGTICLDDPTPILNNLEMGGVDQATRDNLAKALKSLSYSALNLQLRKEEGEGHALSCKLQGSATSGKTTVPVSFGITLHGDLEELINTGLRATLK